MLRCLDCYVVRQNCQKLRGQVFSLIANPNICQLQSILDRTDEVILCNMQRKDGQNNQSITQARITVTEKLALLSKTNRPGSILISRSFFIWPLPVVLVRVNGQNHFCLHCLHKSMLLKKLQTRNLTIILQSKFSKRWNVSAQYAPKLLAQQTCKD